jgi:hypothetical protein
VLTKVAIGLAEAGQGDQAIEAAAGIKDSEERLRTLATLARSVKTASGSEMIHNAVCEILLRPYARAYVDAIPVAVIERLVAEGRQI